MRLASGKTLHCWIKNKNINGLHTAIVYQLILLSTCYLLYATKMNRFASTTQSDIDFLITKSKNRNTERSTSTWMKTYFAWAILRGKASNIQDLEPKELDLILQTFFAEVKKQDGTDYEPGTLCAMQNGIERFLVDNRYQVSILRDKEFMSSRSVLEGKARLLREQGMGKRPNKASSLTTEEEELLWNCGQLGWGNPISLINTLWWLFTQHFGMRGRQEHRGMKIEDLTIKKSDNGKEFITYAEGITKTRQSGLHEKHRLQQPKMFETGTDRCPLKIFRFYVSKRPDDMQEAGPFYLAINHSHLLNNTWFKKAPLGENTINNIMVKMKNNSPLANSTKKMTNHSARKTLVKKLRKNNVPKSEVITITGHNSEAGLDAYDSGDEEQQERLSLAIDGVAECSSSSVDKTNNTQLPIARIISANDPRITRPTFQFFQKGFTGEQSPLSISNPAQVNPLPNFHFHTGCNVTINNYNHPPPSDSKIPPPTKRRRLVIYSSSESSQEE